jgi:hypothetical protein
MEEWFPFLQLLAVLQYKADKVIVEILIKLWAISDKIIKESLNLALIIKLYLVLEAQFQAH